MDTGWLEMFFVFVVVDCFLLVVWLGKEAVRTEEHPCRGGLSNRAARMVRGLDPDIG